MTEVGEVLGRRILRDDTSELRAVFYLDPPVPSRSYGYTSERLARQAAKMHETLLRRKEAAWQREAS